MAEDDKIRQAAKAALASFTDTTTIDSDSAGGGDPLSGADSKEVVIPQSCWLDPSEDIKDDIWLLRQQGVGFSPLGDLQALRGMEGNGKSFFFTTMMAAILRGEYGTLTCDIPDAKVLYIDTEQHKNNVQRVRLRVHHICGWPGKVQNPRFRILTLRNVDDIANIQAYILQAIEEFNPTAVFLDGIGDTVSSINNEKDCKAWNRRLMKLCLERNMSMWNVLHVNYGSDKMGGHLGSDLARKASDVMACQKHKENGDVWFEVEQVKARNKDIEKITFRISDEKTYGIPVITNAINKDSDTPTNRGERDDLMKEILGYNTMSKLAITKEIQNKRGVAGSEASKEKANLWFDQAVSWGIIVLDNHLRQYKYVGLNSDPLGGNFEATQTEMFPESED